MGKSKKSLSLVLLTILLTIGIVGCSSDEEASKEVNMEELPDVEDYSEKLTLHLSGSFTQGEIEDDNWVQKKLEEMFNVEIVNTKLNTWNADETSLAVASGDVPDTFSFTSGTLTAQEMYDGGVTRTIPKEMIKKYAPRYSEMLDENQPGWDLNLLSGSNEEYIQLTGLQSHTKGILWAPTFRLDWLEELGIEPPGEIKPVGPDGGLERIYFTDEAYSLEEVEEILKAFTFDDPDGNGKDDTYGLLPYNNQLHWMTTIMGAHGVAPGYNLMEDDKLKSAEISNKYKEGLKLLAKWYDMGIVDPEWTTLDVEKAWEKYKIGKTGYFTAQRSYVAMEDWTKLRAPQNLILSDPDAKLLVTAPEIGPDGQQGEGSWMPVTLLGDGFQIAKDVTDIELARILQIFDYINHDDEARWTLYGEVGEHSEWQGTPEESAILVKEEYPAEEGDMGFWAYNFRTYPGERLKWLTSEYTFNLMEQFFAKPEVVEEMAIRPYRYDLFEETKGLELEKRYSGQLDTIVDEFRMRAIVGEIDVDKEWDSYVENWLNNGGQEILDELEKAPKVSDLLAE
ncbi:ABC transporter substrate-binding protein [Virgibacillus profundi]|uniref:ABC transporter substrate-binding protein n=1 Tax=Virgibacillus profundi TaxID=2024555 RepID=A0A2A2IHB3_9BACI|nr:ABC transporter substrate-binding protein [Virgibacillus profundi]PAV31169.1 ABC transporter substrate-binding protein [Virgibacillus profundi]PXY55352.1 ABC transporter substrate-binding protein [Virgibacillus profundi]